MPQQFTHIIWVRLSAWEFLNLFTNGLAHFESENRDAILAPKQAGEVNSDSITTVAQTRQWLTHFSLCCCSLLVLQLVRENMKLHLHLQCKKYFYSLLQQSCLDLSHNSAVGWQLGESSEPQEKLVPFVIMVLIAVQVPTSMGLTLFPSHLPVSLTELMPGLVRWIWDQKGSPVIMCHPCFFQPGLKLGQNFAVLHEFWKDNLMKSYPDKQVYNLLL